MVFKLFFKIVTNLLIKPCGESYVTYKGDKRIKEITEKGEMV